MHGSRIQSYPREPNRTPVRKIDMRQERSRSKVKRHELLDELRLVIVVMT